MCANCATILDILRDGELSIGPSNDDVRRSGPPRWTSDDPMLVLAFDQYASREMAQDRARAFLRASLNICSNRFEATPAKRRRA